MNTKGEVLPCSPQNPFIKYDDNFDVYSQLDGRIKLIGDVYTIYKNDATQWSWVCTKRTSSKSAIVETSEKNGYRFENISFTSFDMLKPPIN